MGSCGRVPGRCPVTAPRGRGRGIHHHGHAQPKGLGQGDLVHPQGHLGPGAWGPQLTGLPKGLTGLGSGARPGKASTLIPFVSSSSKEPMSKASAAFTSPRGGISGGGYCGRTRAGHQHGQGLQSTASPGPPVTFCKKTICQSRERKKGLSFTSWALWGDAGQPLCWLCDLRQVP